MQYLLIYPRRFEDLLSPDFSPVNLSFTPYCVNVDNRTSLSPALSENGRTVFREFHKSIIDYIVSLKIHCLH